MMNRKLWIPLLSLGILALVVAGMIFARPLIVANASASPAVDQAVSNAPAAVGSYYWSFAAKFVCGYQPVAPAAGGLPGEPVVKPGNYATDINIHNPNYKEAPLIKHVIVLVKDTLVVREPATALPTLVTPVVLPIDSATMDDCNNLWTLINPNPQNPPPTPMPLFIGYLVILSPFDLNVNVVYTSNAPGIVAQPPTSNSIDVQPVTGKRMFIPGGTPP